MRKVLCAGILILIMSMASAGCGKPIVPPGTLIAEGALSGVTLHWTPSTDPDLTAYLVERSVEGAPFVELETVDAGTTVFSDTDVADGELYRYQVRALADTKKSEPSNVAVSMHGTRITDQTADFTTNTGESPYVIEGPVSFAGSLTVAQGTKLYILPGASLTFSSSWVAGFQISRGLLHIRGTEGAPVTLISTGGGFAFSMVRAASGSLVEYAQFSKLKGLAGGTDSVVFSACSPAIRYSRFESKDPGSVLGIYNHNDFPCDPVIENCYFRDFGLYFQFGVSENMRILSCLFTGGVPAIMFCNFYTGDRLLGSEQLVDNIFQLSTQATDEDLYYSSVAVSGVVPLGGNYFCRGAAYETPVTEDSEFRVDPISAAASFSFSGLLSSRPDAGPGWGDLPF